MRFYTKPHKHYCGIDLHARTMFVCIVDQQGNTLLQRNIPTSPAELRAVIAPFREDLVVSAECVFCWYWLADFCTAEGIPFVLGHALYMRAIHGAKAKNDRIDAFKIASLLRGGNMPVSYVYPAAMRATRDLLRRRLYLVRERGFLLAHVQNTHHQCNLPTPGASLQWRSNRAGVAEHFTDECVRRTVEVDLAVVSHLDTVIRELELFLTNTTKEQDAESFHLLRSIPGVGKVLAITSGDGPKPASRGHFKTGQLRAADDSDVAIVDDEARMRWIDDSERNPLQPPLHSPGCLRPAAAPRVPRGRSASRQAVRGRVASAGARDDASAVTALRGRGAC